MATKLSEALKRIFAPESDSVTVRPAAARPAGIEKDFMKYDLSNDVRF